MTAATAQEIQSFLGILEEKSQGKYAYGVELGRVNARVFMVPMFNGEPMESSRSVYCFIRLSDGAILKSASWKAPAKGVRAWIRQVLDDPSVVDYSGRWLYRFH